MNMSEFLKEFWVGILVTIALMLISTLIVVLTLINEQTDVPCRTLPFRESYDKRDNR